MTELPQIQSNVSTLSSCCEESFVGTHGNEFLKKSSCEEPNALNNMLRSIKVRRTFHMGYKVKYIILTLQMI